MVLLLGACGTQAAESEVTVGSPTPAAGNADAAGLPASPPNDERHPDLYDENGCLRSGDGDATCETTSVGADVGELGQGEGSWRSLAGFVGPRYSTDAGAGGVTILAETVTMPASGPWRAWGLLRNEASHPVGNVVLHADLLDATGTVLESVEALVLVPSMRPGEPAPFDIEGTVDTGLVTDVRWAAAAEPGVERARDLELTTWWTRGFADPTELASYLFEDPAGPKPAVTFGSVTNVGAGDVEVSGVVGAWTDADGRVLWVEEATVTRPRSDADLDAVDSAVVEPDGDLAAAVAEPDDADPSNEPSPSPGEQPPSETSDIVELFPVVGPTESADWLLVAQSGHAPGGLDGATIALWGFGA